jgi:hypothetical protein
VEFARGDCALSRPTDGPVVVTRLSGGLGNQLFQYAAGRSLAHQSGARLVIDATAFTLPVEPRKFALGPYPIDADVRYDGYAYEPVRPTLRFPRPVGFPERPDGPLDAIMYILGKRGGAADRIVRALWRLAHRASGGAGLAAFAERSYDYDPRFAHLGRRTYLVGYWQSYRYFDDVHDLIRRETTLPRPPDHENLRWLTQIRQSNSVCVHVRRGDYLLPRAFDHHGVCSEDYYRCAIHLIEQRVSDPRFFVFSDDLDWCRGRFSGANVALVDANSADAAHDELRLMASCRHHIIANSSLSWWGAWLARHDDQIVVGPDPWFTELRRTPDLYPPNWLAVPRDRDE